ncbi:hypothetical protein COT08_00495 [Candidatus Woesebacteria bacterium CG07_land_8_20_14_0_80_44_9]|uniref:Uncharacterized protein n=2 Tax=Candidatus Woeseibacteriota TaxID=1752722 RepID=A0A2H0BJH7_9BACT|nr:MAG: hypothetical protein COX04_01010 [Candidatus Woesebacteria bacterium CG22_combo_CG10-13_8_21_14_all_45_10]PIU28788.1 MAG: hypothetical protein COT08_00495 [Candidatus Woesebacteria bacterium CG07_land_8_20_14_0_80_44_9]
MLAQDLNAIQTSAIPTFAFSGKTLGDIISAILPYIFTISGILVLLYFLVGGFQLMFAGGDPKKVQGAWVKITNALIGFVIIILAYFLTQLFGKILNIPKIMNIFQ